MSTRNVTVLSIVWPIPWAGMRTVLGFHALIQLMARETRYLLTRYLPTILSRTLTVKMITAVLTDHTPKSRRNERHGDEDGGGLHKVGRAVTRGCAW